MTLLGGGRCHALYSPTYPVSVLGDTKDDQARNRACTEPFPRDRAPQSHGTVCSQSSLPPPFLPRVQGRELAPASGSQFCSPSAGTKDAVKVAWQ